MSTRTGSANDVSLSLVLPAHNEADRIEETIRSFYEEIATYGKVQVVVGEDGSTDCTRDVLRALAAELPIRLVLAPERRGYARAVRDALLATDTDWILFVDSDGQYLRKDISKFLRASNDWDMVIGRKMHRRDPVLRLLMSSSFNAMVRHIFSIPYADLDCGYRLIRGELAHLIAPRCGLLPYSFWTEFTIRAFKEGCAITETFVDHGERLAGTSRIYRPQYLPSIVGAQVRGLWSLWFELRDLQPSQAQYGAELQEIRHPPMASMQGAFSDGQQSAAQGGSTSNASSGAQHSSDKALL